MADPEQQLSFRADCRPEQRAEIDDHGRAFWSALGRVMPDYERRRDELRKVGATFGW
jgi:hypothetical protein